MYPRNLVAAVVAAIAVITGALLAYSLTVTPPQPVRATVLPAPLDLPEFALVDQHGRPVDETLFEGQWDFLFFGFTHCPDICPLTLDLLSRVRRQLESEGIEPVPRIVLVSVDPERDSPETLARYVSHFGEDVVGVTGSLEEVRKLTGGLGIYFEKVPAGDGYTVDHSTAVLLVDPEGRFAALFGGPHDTTEFVHDLPIVTASR